MRPHSVCSRPVFPHRLCYLIIDDLDCELIARQGTVVILRGVTPSRRSQERAIELVRSLWEDGRLPAERFANGITEESIMSLSELPETLAALPADKSSKAAETAEIAETSVLPVEQGAIELCQLLALQVAYQTACTEARPLMSLVQAVLEEERSLTQTELELASDRKTGKILQKVASSSADLTRFRATMSGHAHLVLEIIRADGLGEPEIIAPDGLAEVIGVNSPANSPANPPAKS